MSQKFRRLLILIATLVAITSTACTPAQVSDYLSSKGVQATPQEVQAITDEINRPKPVLASAHVAAFPCRKGHCTTAAGWAFLRNCESHNNYRAVSASGKYRGAYQMDPSFWRTYGDGSASTPDRATPASQDAAAYRGYLARGASPWTADNVKCGRKL